MEKGTPTPSTCFLVSKILPHQQFIFQGVAKVIVQFFLVGVEISVKVFSSLASMPEEPSIFGMLKSGETSPKSCECSGSGTVN